MNLYTAANMATFCLLNMSRNLLFIKVKTSSLSKNIRAFSSLLTPLGFEDQRSFFLI